MVLQNATIRDLIPDGYAQPVEVYRGVVINRFEDVLGFYSHSADHVFCFVTRYRKEDDGPILSFAPTVEQAREEIDWELGDDAALQHMPELV